MDVNVTKLLQCVQNKFCERDKILFTREVLFSENRSLDTRGYFRLRCIDPSIRNLDYECTFIDTYFFRLRL